MVSKTVVVVLVNEVVLIYGCVSEVGNEVILMVMVAKIVVGFVMVDGNEYPNVMICLPVTLMSWKPTQKAIT